MNFTHAIVRAPSERFADGLTTAGLGPPDVSLAVRQHEAYVSALTACKVAVPLTAVLHLKTGVAWLGGDAVLVIGELADHDAFTDFDRITVPDVEAYAANSLLINGTVLMPEGFPRTAAAAARRGYPVHTLDMSEFRKMDGGLSCLSLRFNLHDGEKG